MANKTMRILFPLKIVTYPQYDCSEDEWKDISPREAVKYEDNILPCFIDILGRDTLRVILFKGFRQ